MSTHNLRQSEDGIIIKNCRTHRLAVKYICVEEDWPNPNKSREVCAECLIEDQHVKHDYRPYREVIQAVQDNAIHALRYYEGCSKYLNLHDDFENAFDELGHQIVEELEQHHKRVMKQLESQVGPANKEWLKQEQQNRLKEFLDSNEWPRDKDDEVMAVKLFHFEQDRMVDDSAKQAIHDNQIIMRRVNKHNNEILFAVKQLLNNHFKQYMMPEMYNARAPRKVDEDDNQLNQLNFDSSTQYVDPIQQTQMRPTNSGIGQSADRSARVPNGSGAQDNHVKTSTGFSEPRPFVQDNSSPSSVRQSPIRGGGAQPSRGSGIQQPTNFESSTDRQNNANSRLGMQKSVTQFIPQDQPGTAFETESFQGTIMRTYDGHTDYVRKVLRVSPDTFLSVSDDSTIKYWNYQRNKCIQDYQGLHRSGILDIKRLKDSVFVSCGKDNRIAWLDVERQLKEIREVRHNIFSLEVLQERYILLGGNKNIFLIDNENKEFISLSIIQPRLLKEAAHEKEILAIKYIQEQSVFATASYDRSVKIWFFQPLKQELHHIKDLNGHRQAVRSLCLGQSSNLLFSGSDDSMVIMWDWQNATQLQTFQGHTGSIYAIDLLSQNEIATGSYDKTIKIWNTSSGKCVGTINGNATGILSLVKLNSQVLLTGCDDHTIKAWA